MNDFQERLQELLEDNKLNRLNLANLLNITPTTVNGYFNKDYYPRMDILIKIANHFNCSIDYVLGLTDDKKMYYKLNLEDYKNNFVKNMALIVSNNKKSVAKIMKELNMSEYNYYRWKNGKFPKTINILLFAKYLDVSIDYLVGRNDKK